MSAYNKKRRLHGDRRSIFQLKQAKLQKWQKHLINERRRHMIYWVNEYLKTGN